MVNKGKKIGTAAETLVVRYMQSRGWPVAKRNPPAGRQDIGDIDPRQPKLVIEVKADKGLRFPDFLRETEAERVNAGASVGVCVIKPPGVGKTRMNLWWMLMSSGTYDALEFCLMHQNPVDQWGVHWGTQDSASRLVSKSFQPGRVLADTESALRMVPGTALKPGATRISRTGWDMRFLYLPDGLELLLRAGLGGATA